MNDSPFGLTASIWTNAKENAASEDVFLKLVDQLARGCPESIGAARMLYRTGPAFQDLRLDTWIKFKWQC